MTLTTKVKQPALLIPKLENTQSNSNQYKAITLNPNKQSEQQTMNKQQQNHRLRTDSSTGDITGQIFILDSAVIKHKYRKYHWPMPNN